MANINKVYTISIQMDAARNQLTDASKKLAELDAQLAGLDQNSDQAKGIIAEMAKLAKEVEGASGEVADLGRSLDNLKPGSIGAMRAEIEELEAALDNTTKGTAEYEAALLKLGNAKGAIKEVDDAVDALDPKMKAAAFVDFANGVVGAFTVATTAAQTFGLSKESAEAYQTKLLTLISVMDGVEQVSRALNSETLAVVKSTYAGAKAWLGMGEAAATSGKVTRAALLSTGIGALIILVAFLAANFDKVKEVGASIAAKFKPEFEAVGGFIDNVIAKARNLASAVSFGLIDDAAKHAQVVAADYRQKELAKQAEHTARLLEIYKARGVDTLALEVDNAKRRLDSLKNSTEEEKKVYTDTRKDYLVLAAQLEKRGNDEQRASRLAFLNGLAATEQARGADTFKQQLAAKKEQIAQLSAAELAGEYVSAAQKQQLQTELDSLQTTHDTQQAEKRRALLSARLNAELAILQTKGVEGLAQIRTQAQDELTLAQQVNAKQLKIAQQNRANLLAVAQVDKGAVVAAEAEIYKLKLEAGRLYSQQRIVQIQEQGALEQRVQNTIVASVEKREQEHQAILAQAQAAGGRVTARVADELAAELALKQQKLAAQADVAGNLFIRLFGINDAQAQDLKARLADFAQVAGSLVSGLLGTAQAEADEQLSAAQAQLQTVTDQLAQAQSAADATSSQLEGASGARRDYLLKKLQAERAEVDKLAAQKAKAAKAEEDAEKRKADLAKQSAQLSAAASLASTIATGTDAVRAAVGVIAGGSSLPFPANLVAIATGLGVVTSAVLQAKSLAKSFGGGGELGDGGEIVGGSHASGNDVPVMGGRYRVEGKEMITNVRSTENNRELLHFINAKGKTRRLTHADLADVGNFSVLPHPTGRTYGGGGELGGGSGAGSVPAGSVVVQAQDLSALLDTNRAMLSHLQAINSATDTTAAHTGQLKDYGPARLQIGPGEAVGIEAQRQQAVQAEQLGTL
jgi:hypothetical protein